LADKITRWTQKERDRETAQYMHVPNTESKHSLSQKSDTYRGWTK